MISRMIAGYGVMELDRAGRRYAYPLDYPNLDRIAASIQLSAAHDDGDVEGLPVDPDSYAAQDAYFSTGTAQSPEFVKSMAEAIDPRFDAVLGEVLDDPARVAALRRVGDHLASGGNIINAVPHGPLLDIGLLHAMAYIALSRLGYDFTIGIVISHGVSGRGKRFVGDIVCLADALDWACDKVWYVTPQTSNARSSAYSAVASAEHIQLRNAVVRADVAARLDAGGILITVAPSATTNRVNAGVHRLHAPTLGTLRLMAHPRTLVAVATGRFLGAATPAYHLDDRLDRFSGNSEMLRGQGADLMARMVAGMRTIDPSVPYDVASAAS